MDALIIKLPAELNISAVTPCHSAMLQQLADSDTQQNIQIDASELLHIDTSGMQLLVALVAEASAQNRTLTWQSISDDLKQCALRLGLTDTLLSVNTPS